MFAQTKFVRVGMRQKQFNITCLKYKISILDVTICLYDKFVWHVSPYMYDSVVQRQNYILLDLNKI